MARRGRKEKRERVAAPGLSAAAPPVRFAAAWLVLAFLLPHAAVLGFGFVYDDFPILLENARLHSLAGLRDVILHEYWPDRNGLTLYRPVTQAVWILVWAASGGSAVAFHALSLALGLGAVLLAYRLLLSLRLAPRTAFLAALLFAVLPLHTEVTASVVGSAESLAACLGLAALLLYRGGRPLLALFAWALAVFSKESSAGLAAFVRVLWWIEKRPLPSRRRWVTETAAAGAVVALALWARLAVARAPAFIPPIDNPMSLVSGPRRVLTALWGQVLYLGRSVFPVHLAADASYKEIPLVMGPDDPRAWAGLLVLGLAVWAFVYRPPARVLIALWTVPFLVTSNVLFPIGTTLGERLAYLPSLGICAGLAALILRIPPRLGRVLAAGAILAYAGRTAHRSLVWRNADSFYPQMAADAPGSARAWYSLGSWHFFRHRDAEALAAYQQAVEIFEPYPEAWNNRGNALVALGRLEEAKESYRQAVRFDPGHQGATASLAALEQGIPFTPQRRRL